MLRRAWTGCEKAPQEVGEGHILSLDHDYELVHNAQPHAARVMSKQTSRFILPQTHTSPICMRQPGVLQLTTSAEEEQEEGEGRGGEKVQPNRVCHQKQTQIAVWGVARIGF